MPEQIFTGIFVFVFGSIVGSFLNVCIVRLPKGESIIRPRSHCIHCQKMIPWYDNVPFLSYLVLRGQCRFCRTKISFRYFLVEFLTAASFVFFYLYFGLTPVFFAYLVMLCGFIIATFVDFEYRIIPDEISVGGMVAGILLSFLIPPLHGIQTPGLLNNVWPHFQALVKALMGVLIGGGTIYVMGILGDFVFKKESMGGGDIKLMAMIGAFMGWKLALLTFFVAPFLGAVYGIVEKIRTKESAIAYGPFLVVGALISLFYGEQILLWIMRGYGIKHINIF